MEVKAEVQHSAEKVWQRYVHEMDKVLPASMPGHFNEMLYVDGPPLAVGSTFIVTYHEDIPHYNSIKFRWDEMNHEEHHFKCTLIDGGALNKHFSYLAYTFNILPGSTPESCVMQYIVEFVDLENHTFHAFIKEELEKFCNLLNSHLLTTSN
ncbi:hypothetical protein GOP47_0001670 [Adiantum capillus-veneris]|uniref:Bet v I/Major latex protein domain-containing protein n=1 Tax=Adiantum capillus-veneris TaxID=13818 RepID=A0A9D4VAH6_ADICA|nr:hypothetical protein GOP47_0001670 [Adiantum capillus-veneris]